MIVLYVILTKVVLIFFSVNGSVMIVWPPSWLAFAILLIGGKKYLPSIFIGAFIASVMMGSSVSISIFVASGNTLGVLAGALFLARIAHFNRSLTHLSDYMWLGIAAVVSGCVYALIGTSSLLLTGLLTPKTFTLDFLHLWERDTLGIILATPIILAWQQIPRGWFKQERVAEAVACFGLAFFAGQIIFMDWFHDTLGVYANAYLMFVFVTWSAVRFGRHGVFLVISITGVQALLGAIQGIGFFAIDIENTDLTNLWLYMLVLTDVGLALDFVMFELRRAERRERSRNQVLELLAKNTPLNEVLQFIVCSVEKENADMLCCILLVDNVAEHLFTGAAADMPDFYNSMAHSAEIDIAFTNCGGDAHAEKHIIVENIQSHPYVTLYQKLSVQISLHSGLLEPIYSHSGKALGTIGIYRRKADISASDDDVLLIKQVANIVGAAIDQSLINDELQLALLIYQNSSEAMAVTGADGTVITINPAFTKFTGYTPDEVIGKNIKILSSGRQDKKFYQAMWHAINTTGFWQGEILNQRKNGEIYTEWLTINTVTNENGSVHRRVAIFSDITNKKEADDLIWKQANFDMLTGLPNRSMFLDRLNQAIKKSLRTNLPLALIFLDLDRFKEVNDTLGHNAGDNLLKEATRRLLSCVRESDTVARLGGDEFVIVLDKLDDLSSIERIAKNLLIKLDEPFYLENEVAYISASIGITLFPNDAADANELLKNADQAMYFSKNTGRNRYSYFTRPMEATAKNRSRLINDLHFALTEGQFCLHYQPIVDLSTGAIDKAEALIRWQHPQRGLVSPAEFIPIAEETGLINDIGEWVFHEAVQQVAIWRTSKNPAFQISINKSPVQFLNKNKTHADWISHLRSLDLPGQCIVVEITEGLLLDNNTSITGQLLEFRDAGMQVSLDDFGTGYSSLSYLQKFDIDYLKIDQSFVRNLSSNSSNMVLCEAIIVMAHKLGMKVIAEGIETQEQRDLLTAAKCDYGQGYLFSKPVPAIEFEKYLNA
ncbi:MAG: EAL domain-containing protein [Methylotenera sp.]|nr:EAL domain-containing protein [Methylotenera sp.]